MKKQLSDAGKEYQRLIDEDRKALEAKYAGDRKYAQMLEKLAKIGK